MTATKSGEVGKVGGWKGGEVGKVTATKSGDTPRLSTWKTIPPGECRLGGGKVTATRRWKGDSHQIWRHASVEHVENHPPRRMSPRS